VKSFGVVSGFFVHMPSISISLPQTTPRTMRDTGSYEIGSVQPRSDFISGLR
jgi:hypothetical protein